MVTKSYGRENTWALGSCESKEAYRNNNVYTQECCFAPSEYDLKCKDSYGDGWHGGYLEIQGKKYCDDFLSGRLKNDQVTITGYL